MNMAYKSDTKVCRLCRCVVESTKTAHLFSSTGVERRWAPRISLLLDVPVDKSDRTSSYMFKICAHRPYRVKPELQVHRTAGCLYTGLSLQLRGIWLNHCQN